MPFIVKNGGAAFAKQGIRPDPQNPRSVGSSGTKLMGVSGHVKTPGVWEFEFGVTAARADRRLRRAACCRGAS